MKREEIRKEKKKNTPELKKNRRIISTLYVYV